MSMEQFRQAAINCAQLDCAQY